ncbi:DUF2807 domain-containing protein [Aggregatimonas sangjinii]|uniref:DUF2807 domain-containing protein n=1 Tax=Aggregatimonas sangjinii TaxID=2583587 RepID=A0A5B7SRR8_9FLAO|nr:head GIN domain-containing protein [Aggregatimonas sangjinii]QCW99700.1 DUF2807 domain-containing protein [Aggregatimonas sangjinii]
MKNLRILCMALLFSAMPSMAQEGNMTVELETFEEIKVFDQINVTLVKSDENKAVVSGDDAQEVSIDNDNGRLKIKMEADNFLDGNDTNVVLYYTNDLSLVDANEGAKITSEDDLESKYLTVRSQEGGKIIIGVNARNLDSKAVTGGEITISGSAENQDVNIRSGGQYNAEKLSSNQTDVTILAGGKAMVNVSDFVDANVTAGGTIEIYGNPETVKEDKTLGGSIILK